jgi:hypothetical protein
VLIADFRALDRKACVSIISHGLIRFKNKKEEGWRLVHFCLANPIKITVTLNGLGSEASYNMHSITKCSL